MKDATPPRQRRLDAIGLAISGVCLVHCLALPLAAVLVPAAAFGFGREADHTFHWVLLGLAVPISSLALWRGAVRNTNWRWFRLGSVGLILMLFGVLHLFGANSEVVVTMFGVSLLALAHVKNFLLSTHGNDAKHSYAIQDGVGTMHPVSTEDRS